MSADLELRRACLGIYLSIAAAIAAGAPACAPADEDASAEERAEGIAFDVLLPPGDFDRAFANGCASRTGFPGVQGTGADGMWFTSATGRVQRFDGDEWIEVASVPCAIAMAVESESAAFVLWSTQVASSGGSAGLLRVTADGDREDHLETITGGSAGVEVTRLASRAGEVYALTEDRSTAEPVAMWRWTGTTFEHMGDVPAASVYPIEVVGQDRLWLWGDCMDPDGGSLGNCILGFDGDTWELVPEPSCQANLVAAGDELYAVSATLTGGCAERWTGTEWEAMNVPERGDEASTITLQVLPAPPASVAFVWIDREAFEIVGRRLDADGTLGESTSLVAVPSYCESGDCPTFVAASALDDGTLVYPFVYPRVLDRDATDEIVTSLAVGDPTVL